MHTDLCCRNTTGKKQKIGVPGKRLENEKRKKISFKDESEENRDSREKKVKVSSLTKRN